MIEITREGARAVIQPNGEDIVAANVPDFRSRIRGALEDGVTELVVDMTHVTMVDSSGIGLLISAHNSLRKRGGRLSVTNVSPEILDLFRSMRIHQHFSVTEAATEEVR